MTVCHLCSTSPKWDPGASDLESLGLPLPPVEPPVVEWAATLAELVNAVLVEPGSKVHLTGPVVTPLEPSRWSSSSGLAYARAPPGRARLLGLKLDPRRRFLILNPDPV